MNEGVLNIHDGYVKLLFSPLENGQGVIRLIRYSDDYRETLLSPYLVDSFEQVKDVILRIIFIDNCINVNNKKAKIVQ